MHSTHPKKKNQTCFLYPFTLFLLSGKPYSFSFGFSHQSHSTAPTEANTNMYGFLTLAYKKPTFNWFLTFLPVFSPLSLPTQLSQHQFSIPHGLDPCQPNKSLSSPLGRRTIPQPLIQSQCQSTSYKSQVFDYLQKKIVKTSSKSIPFFLHRIIFLYFIAVIKLCGSPSLRRQNTLKS